jgi:protein phosphatase 2C
VVCEFEFCYEIISAHFIETLIGMSAHHSSLIGLRPTNEDQHIVKININGDDQKLANVNLYAVMDGHGGPNISKRVKELVYKVFLNPARQYPLGNDEIEKYFNAIERKLETDKPNYANNMGCTCLIVVEYRSITGTHLQIMNIGDSRVIMNRGQLGIPLSKDHKPGTFDERRRIEEIIATRGDAKLEWDGFDWRIKGLSVSRAFGDVLAKPYIEHLPEVFHQKLDKKVEFIILACDGVWDVISSQDAVNFVMENMSWDPVKKKAVQKDGRKNLAKALAQYAIDKGSTDNVSAIIVFF